MKMIKNILVIAIIIFMPLLSNATPKPPSNGYVHGSGQNQPAPGGGAPIDGGLSILLLLGSAFGGAKVYKLRKAVKA